METTLRTEVRPDGVGIIFINVRDSAQNVMRPKMGDEFRQAFQDLQRQDVKAVVLASDKEGSWMAGADIEVFRRCRSAEEVSKLSRQMQALLDDIEIGSQPVVAAIHGTCLGGGLELALACHGRIASDAAATKLGLPEVQLGLLPGAGGTQRLPETVGLEMALDMLLTGKHLEPKKALGSGLVDQVVPRAHLIEAASRWGLLRAAQGPKKTGPFQELTGSRLKELAMANNPVGRNIVFGQAEKMVARKAGRHYPAPHRILDVVRTGLEKGRKAGLEAEARAMGELAMSDVAHRLIELFFAQQSLKKDRGAEAEPLPVSKVGVLGAGLMGRGIAYVTVDRAGIPVRLKDRDDAAVGGGLRAVRALVMERVGKKRLTPREAERTLMRLTGTTEDSFERCDLIIEAVFEDLELKQRLLRTVEAQTPDTTIFATNTSSIPIQRIAEAARRKDRVVGMHYFSPVEKMPLLEVIRTPETSDETVATAVALGKQQGKTVIVVNDGVGFYTSRVLGPYINEAAWMLSEGIPVEVIDDAARKLGFPVGPCTLLDEVGIDVAAKVSKIAEEAYGTRFHPPGSLDRLIQDGRTGRKGQKGFYRYGGKKKEVDATVYEVLGVVPNRKSRPDLEVLQDRLLIMMVQEAVRCFDQGIVRSARDADVGAIFGLGFPPHLGGPLRWVDAIGPGELLSRMRALMDRCGGRFAPPERLERMAKSGDRFHTDA